MLSQPAEINHIPKIVLNKHLSVVMASFSKKERLFLMDPSLVSTLQRK
jgi:hypothetical protein